MKVQKLRLGSEQPPISAVVLDSKKIAWQQDKFLRWYPAGIVDTPYDMGYLFWAEMSFPIQVLWTPPE